MGGQNGGTGEGESMEALERGGSMVMLESRGPCSVGQLRCNTSMGWDSQLHPPHSQLPPPYGFPFGHEQRPRKMMH